MKKEVKNATMMPRLTKFMLAVGFLLTTIFSYAGNLAYAQNQTFTIHLKNVTIKTVLQTIEKQSEFIFMYRSDLLDTSKKVSVNADRQSVSQILDQILEGTAMTYEINDRQILLKKVEDSKSNLSLNGTKETVKITGAVMDGRTDDVIIGATVQVKGKSTGVITDLDGKFEIEAGIGEVLVISYIGYATQEVEIKNNRLLVVRLYEDTKQLEEVVVTAYGGGQKKASMVGAVESIKPEQLKVPSANLSNSFAGRLAGVIAVQRSGAPGADGSNFYIRGISTMSGATNPLIILDGVEISSGDLNQIDPEIIESFSILKDATATAMYGTRGANGVMIVTTKTGRNIDKPIINFRIEGQMNTPTSIPEFVDGARYMELFNEAINNEGDTSTMQPYTQEEIDGTRAGLNPYIFPNVNWYNELFKKNSYNQNVNVNIRGGGKYVDYFSSITVNHLTGMIKDRSTEFFSYNNSINIMRYAFQNNINAYLSKSTKLSLRLNVQLNDGRQPGVNVGTLFSQTMNTSPVEAPVYFPADGIASSIKWGTTDRLKPGLRTNPLASLANGYTDTFSSTVISALEFEQGLDFITKGLSFKALASFKNYSYNATGASANWNMYHLDSWSLNDGVYEFTTRLNNASAGEVDTNLNPTVGNSGDRRFYFQTYFNYARTFGDHEVNAMLLYNQDEKVIHLTSANLVNALPYRKQGLAGRLSYAYAGKYLAEVNMGYNGSENFAKGHRWGFFPSIALGYNISEEEFFQPLRNVISRLKLRGSWGLVGNDNIGAARFAYMPIVNMGNLGYTTGIESNTSYYGPSYGRYANLDMTWEVGEKINIGADLQFFNSLDMTLEFFQENRRNIFQERTTVPGYIGVTGTSIYGNYAAMKNHGFDLSLNYNKQFNKDLFVSMKGTFTYAHNEITKIDESPKYDFQSKVGQSANMNGVLISNGLFVSQEEVDAYNQNIGGILGAGDIKYVDVSGQHGYDDGIVNADDWMWKGYPTIPEIVYGFGPSIKWKNLDFSFFFQGVARTSLILSGFHPFGDESLRNVLKWVDDDHWSSDNQNVNAAYPRLTMSTSTNNTRTSDYWLRNGAFLKLKNAEIGYTHKNMRFYLSGMNLLTFAPFKHWDPEQGGGSGLIYPTQRTFNVGFQMTIDTKR